MQEIREGFLCVLSFGKDWKQALQYLINDQNIDPNINWIFVNNPVPTGDHWKSILLVRKFQKKGRAALVKLPQHKLDFVFKVSEHIKLSKSGFCMATSSMVSRNYRDVYDLRHIRGKVFVFFIKHES